MKSNLLHRLTFILVIFFMFVSKTHSDPIYLDYQASTPVDPKVLQSMLPYFTKTSVMGFSQ